LLLLGGLRQRGGEVFRAMDDHGEPTGMAEAVNSEHRPS
jgi:hypothetical protein